MPGKDVRCLATLKSASTYLRGWDVYKRQASILCGILCGFAGAHLSLGYLTMFTEGMSNDRGFIAFACVIFGMANPPKVFLAALLLSLIHI